MAAPQGLRNRDLVTEALAGPIDWARFESLVHAILVADDFPRLEKIGGTNDHGMDAVDESFYDGQRRIQTVIQVTSAGAQKAKVKDTIKKLKLNGIEVRTLVFISRHPVSSEARRSIIADGEDEAVAVEIRDDSYLVAQLCKPQSPIFARFFGTTQEQFEALVSSSDPLGTTSTRAQHALLATLGAFVLSPRARLARNTLFDKTLLAVIASAANGVTIDDAVSEMEHLSASKVDKNQLHSAFGRLESESACTKKGDLYFCNESTLARFVTVAKAAENGFQSLLSYVWDASERGHKLTDAQGGYLERNVRRALLQLLRTSGPIKDHQNQSLMKASFNSDDLLRIIGHDLPPRYRT